MFYTTLSTIGVNCHEMGHVFGLPDLYDTTIVGGNYASSGIGMWSIMAGGSWAGPNGGNGSKPVHFDPWSKAGLGWITPTVVTSFQAATALPAFWQNANSVLRIPVDPYNDGEYFLVANRFAFNTGNPATGFDQYVPGSGALVLHVDDYVPGNDVVTHKKVDVEEADGLAQLDLQPGTTGWNQGNPGDLYPIGGTTFNGTSNPNSRDNAGNLTGIALTNFTGADTANMAVDVTPHSSIGASIVYDEMGAMGDSDGYSDGGDDFGLVRFTAPANGAIWRIKTYFVYPGTTNYTVKIFSGLSGGLPTGLLATKSGSQSGGGAGTIALSAPVSISAGEDFYVEIEYNTGGGYGWPIPMTRDTTPEERSYKRTSNSASYTQLLVANGDTDDINIRVDYLPTAVTAPAVATAPATGLTNTSATLNGKLTATGGQNPTVHIYWGAVDGATTATLWAHDLNLGVLAAGVFSADITGLNAGSTYYFRAYAVNSAGGVWASSSANFVTDPTVTAPVVADAPVTNLTATAATLNGIVTGMGGENPTVHVYWGLADGGTTTSTWAHDENLGTHGLGAFSVGISSLTTSDTYYYRAYAANSGGAAWAPASSSFVPRDQTPAIVANAAATSVTRTTAVLNGAVTDTGGVTPVITIFYGTADGGTTPGAWDSSVEVGLAAVGAFSAPVTGLTAETTYYFRVRAVNTIGTSWAPASMSFTTALNPLVPPTGLTASKGTSADHVAVSWSASAEATYYKVFRAASATGTPQELTGWIAATNYNDTSAALSVVYYYWVEAARGAAGEDATALSSSDVGWIGMVGPTANFKITYKHCTVSVVHNSLVQVSNATLASIKIDKLKNMSSRSTSIPGKVTYIVGSTGIPRLDIAGSVSKFSSSAPIATLTATGTINSLSTTGVAIPTISAGALGSVKMTAYAMSDSAHQQALTTIHAGDTSTSGTLTSGAPLLKMALTGVGLYELRAPQQTVSIALASKKWRNANRASDLSLASVPHDTGNVVEAGSLLQIASKGGWILPGHILGSATVNDSSVISAQGLLFSGAAGPTIYDGTVAPDEIVSQAGQLTVSATAGNVGGSRIVAGGEISLLSAQHKMFRSAGGVTYVGGAMGLASTSGTMHVVSGANHSFTNSGIARVFGSVSVRGNFYAGGDGTLGALYGGALQEVGTDKPGSFPANPTIAGGGWSSQPIQFFGGNHTGFVMHTP
jgi:hypothetical protein